MRLFLCPRVTPSAFLFCPADQDPASFCFHLASTSAATLFAALIWLRCSAVVSIHGIASRLIGCYAPRLGLG